MMERNDIQHTHVQPPALTGDTATDRKNYIDACFVMDFETMTKQRKTVVTGENCNLQESNEVSCDFGAIHPGDALRLDPGESASSSSIYAWDKCGEGMIFDETSDPGDLVSYVDDQLSILRSTQIAMQPVSQASTRRKRRH